MKTNFYRSICMLVMFLISFIPTMTVHSEGILFVKSEGTGDCSSWEKACSLQSALTKAVSGDEIWVQGGIYYPTSNTLDRTATFQLRNNVSLYGGFSGYETDFTQRDVKTNRTILSGDIDKNDSQWPYIDDPSYVTGNTTNSFHVVSGSSDITQGIFDGFIISAGYANGGGNTSYGAGIYLQNSSIHIENVIIIGNVAENVGGMYINSGSQILQNISFKSNQSAGNGAGLGIYNSISTSLMNVTFSENETGNSGGGLFIDGSTTSLVNTTFANNISGASGGGLFIDNMSTVKINNTTLNYNSADSYGGSLGISGESDVTIQNTISYNHNEPTGNEVYSNSSGLNISDSIFSNGCPVNATCTRVINNDPLLGYLGDYGGTTETIPLQTGSSAINTGNNSTCASVDQRGVSRPQGVNCDMGAFELEDFTNPQIESISIQDDPNNGYTYIYYIIRFSEAITGVDKKDFKLITQGLPGATIDIPNIVGTESTIVIVPVYSGLGDGTIRLDIPGDATITDWFGHPLSNIPYTDGPTLTLERNPPWVLHIQRADDNPTFADIVNFTVTFSEPVSCVFTSDFVLTTNGITGAAISGISGSGTTYTVSVLTGTGVGTIRLDLVDYDSIVDYAGKPLGGVGLGNGNFSNGGAYIVRINLDEKVYIPLTSR